MTTFKNLNLREKILDALDKKGYVNPTPVQLQAIPHVMEKKDLLAIAQTGTGKTAAFSLPILHNLVDSTTPVKSGCVKVLILTPTRELASQIADNIELYGKDLGFRHAVIFGGVSERPQIAALQRGVDILIATPGRLLDLTNQGYIRYMQLEVFVLDEADRMLDMGFINDIKKIIQKIPPKRQTLFFSATMPDTITDLANSILNNPVRVEVTPPSSTVDRIEQKVYYVEKNNKAALLKSILKQDDVKNVLVFCKMKHGANKVVEHLERHNIKVAAIHGNKSQGAREKALADFRSGANQVLVATDIAARGIDIPGISHVVNYDIPMDPESYVHRIGRTARAGLEGIAISFCDPTEKKLLAAVEKVIKMKIPVDETHPFHGVAASPTSRDDERDSPAPRKPGFAGRGRAPNHSRQSPRRDEKTGGDRRRSANRSDDSRPSFNKKEEGKSSMFGIFGFGKKKSDANPRARREGDVRTRDDRRPREDDRRSFGDRGPRAESDRKPFGDRRPRAEGDRKPFSDRRPSAPRFGDEGAKKKSFGFGWFKKSDSADSGRRGERSSDSRRPNSDVGDRSRRSDSPSDRRGGYASSGSGSATSRRPSSGNRMGTGSSRSGNSFGGSRPSGGGKRFS